MKTYLIILCLLGSVHSVFAQPVRWAFTDKQTLLDQYQRTQKEVNDETAGLSVAQWNFREAPDRWNIGEVLEHLNMWQLVTLENVRYALYLGPHPELAQSVPSDSVTSSFIYEEEAHVSPDFTIPTGLIPDVNNLKIFNLKCKEIIKGIEANQGDLRAYIRLGKDGWHRNLAQMYIIQYGHVDRHLRQIRKIKADAKFPGN